MKKNVILYCLVILLTGGLFTSCDVEIESDEKISGDIFWAEGTEANMRGYLNSMYYYLRKATMQDAAYLLYSGEFRCGPIETSSSTSRSEGKYVLCLRENDLNGLRQYYTSTTDYRAGAIMNWKTFYQVIQEANIMLKEIDQVPISEDRRMYYRYESRFVRALTYFLLVRNFGDVPFYTKAYNQEALERTDMVTILKFLSDDVKDMLDSDPDAAILPWTHVSMADKATKASRGAALALLMHINMWLAGFDKANANSYYTMAVNAGEELVERNGGAYSLLPLSQTATIFRGGSSEGLFEIAQDISYGSGDEVFNVNAVYSNYVMFNCLSKSVPNIYYPYDYMLQLYDNSDERIKYWFDDNAFSSIVVNKEVKKFLNSDTYDGSNVTSNAGNQIVFRFTESVLLYAEALAELGTDDEKACELLNQIRRRANLEDTSATGQDLKDAIYWERVRELIGECHYFYDLVRTGKVCDGNYCFHPITRSAFNRGAWTWPISKSALDNNTHIQLNLYWE